VIALPSSFEPAKEVSAPTDLPADVLKQMVTGPAPLDAPNPDRQYTRTVEDLLTTDTSDLNNKEVRRNLATIVQTMNGSARGQRLLQNMADNDIRIGGLTRGNNYGYYLAYDRALYQVNNDADEGIRVMSHEARHAEQTVAGYSTLIEYYKPGTKLPYDARSYLLLNRIVEADADATSVGVAWEISQSDPSKKRIWDLLKEDVHFGQMAESFEAAVQKTGLASTDPAAVRAGMEAVFNGWMNIGTPLRADGYDRYLLAFIEKKTGEWGEVQANARLTAADIRNITSLGDSESYWDPAKHPNVMKKFEVFPADIEARLAAVDQRLKPAPVTSIKLPSGPEAGLPPALPRRHEPGAQAAADVSRWRHHRRSGENAAAWLQNNMSAGPR
jgi:hypothetical protein